ncbi:MAG: hypothetical protein DMG64_15040 [Acidobacteria bacterium]|nr:MAG: hypothetical protein DMG63_13940 [Acidobacteriota bacterium]PYY01200.1 MAG: hypothetical protein DMG64_15040 [Acidobacteriota bacterium]PYY22761.1 MAG: hypothetical protein DMG62_11335 [Acidobacteriota bacterium]
MVRWTFAAIIVLTAAFSAAQNKQLADYQLRIHIFRRSETTFYHMRVAEEAKGEGRANLFENGQPRGMDFQFNCAHQLQTSSGFETFPAKWKKPNQELEVLLPEFGKSDKYEKCKLEVQMKDFAYVQRNGALGTEPTESFKQWMVKHDYDPEHGKNTPMPNPPNPQSANGAQPTPAH